MAERQVVMAEWQVVTAERQVVTAGEPDTRVRRLRGREARPSSRMRGVEG